MAQTRVLSIRFTEDEYSALQAMSLVTGAAVNTIVREAVNEKADRAADDPEFAKQAVEAKKRFEEANDRIKRRVQDVSVAKA